MRSPHDGPPACVHSGPCEHPKSEYILNKQACLQAYKAIAYIRAYIYIHIHIHTCTHACIHTHLNSMIEGSRDDLVTVLIEVQGHYLSSVTLHTQNRTSNIYVPVCKHIHTYTHMHTHTCIQLTRACSTNHTMHAEMLQLQAVRRGGNPSHKQAQ